MLSSGVCCSCAVLLLCSQLNFQSVDAPVSVRVNRAAGGLLSQSWAAQLAELETDLAKSDADWKIVVGHHPVISNGKHGGTEELQQHLQPLLEKYGVQVSCSMAPGRTP